MSWQTPLVLSRADAKSFLETQMGRLQTEAVPLVLYPHIQTTHGLSARVSAEGERFVLFEMTTEASPSTNTTDVHRLAIRPPIKGKGFGAMALKCAIGIAYEFKHKAVRLLDVDAQGWTFWPHMGAVPEKGPSRLMGRHIERQLELHEKTVSPARAAGYRHLIRQAGEDVFALWFSFLALVDRRGPDYAFQENVLKAACRGKNMVINLKDPCTYTRLRRKLGPLPPFPTHSA